MGIKSVKEAKTLGEVLRFRPRPEATAFLFEDRRTDYATFDRYASQVAQGLLAEGCAHGARIAFLDKNSDLFYELIFGCAKAGAVSIDINWRLAPPEVAYVVNDSAAGAFRRPTMAWGGHRRGTESLKDHRPWCPATSAGRALRRAMGKAQRILAAR